MSLQQYQELLKRVVEESMEVALLIANNDLKDFTLAKLYDLFNQILPTAFVLTTGYWPYFSTPRQQSLCVCGRFGLPCPHTVNTHHWLDLEKSSNDATMPFSSRMGDLQVDSIRVEIRPVGENCGFYIKIFLMFSYRRPPRLPVLADELILNPNSPMPVTIASRYSIRKEFYPPLGRIQFHPNPLFIQSYGSVLGCLLQRRSDFFMTNNYNVDLMPPFTLVIQTSTVPVQVYPVPKSSYTHARLAYLFDRRRPNDTYARNHLQFENMYDCDHLRNIWTPMTVSPEEVIPSTSRDPPPSRRRKRASGPQPTPVPTLEEAAGLMTVPSYAQVVKNEIDPPKPVIDEQTADEDVTSIMHADALRVARIEESFAEADEIIRRDLARMSKSDKDKKKR